MKAVEFRATIRDTPASLRFGSEVPSVTLDVCPADESQAVALIALKKTGLRVRIEIDDSPVKQDETDGSDKRAIQGRAQRKSERTSAKKPSSD